MEYGSINRRIKNKHRIENDPRARRSFSTSNLSFKSTSSTSVGRRSVYVRLPKDFGCDLSQEGRVLSLAQGGPAHASGVIQVGDYVRVYGPVTTGAGDDCEGNNGESSSTMVTVHVFYGILQVETRPACPLVIKIGNKSNTALGIALTDTPDKRIKISSIQAGSLADRCGFLAPGDLLTSVQVSPIETIPCSPYYTSFQVAQILRRLAMTKTSLTLTIVPVALEESAESSDNNSGSTMTLQDSSLFQDAGAGANSFRSSNRKAGTNNKGADINECILSLCLWKDRLYEDWGFSLIDPDGESVQEDEWRKGAYVHQIRPGGPAYIAGLRPGDRFLQINDRDVKNLESTILVPILASLDDSLNLVVARTNFS